MEREGTRAGVSIVVMALVLALFVAACGEEKDEEPAGGGGGGGGGSASAEECGTVTLNEQAWAGSTANTYIAKAVLEEDLGCTVEITKITEIPVFQAMADGKVDAVLEDWQHVDEYKQYIDEAGTVVMGGPLGVEGHIGWFIPQYLMEENPEFKTWEGLKGNEELFQTPESGDQGMFLGGDPSYVQKDKELIEALDLNFKHVTAGAEPAQVARWSQLYKQEEPVHLLLVHAAVPQPGVRPRRGDAAAAHRGEQGLPGRRQGRRRPRAIQVRVRHHDHQQALQQGVRGERVAGVRHAEAR